MSILSTARIAFLSSALVLAAGIGAQANSSALDFVHTAVQTHPGKVKAVQEVMEKGNATIRVVVDGDDGAMHTMNFDKTSGDMTSDIQQHDMMHDLLYGK
ncbi:hypothetical protein [Oricola nitratireducens]|jgi:uncharacterized iron-regulated membrane protein|uniref:hypothetical protein n=1 Tax=Oricola nitratireducens TaxID=2775868 RepID=UPI001869492E|nr:hypothetical protein [Oricola nitratireducens]